MLDELLINLDKISFEVLIEAVLVFALTMLIKLPIKKRTAKFEENKRKALNTFIIFIPMFLSVLLSTLYSGYFFKIWSSLKIYQNAISVYILSVTIYAIFSRIMVIVKSANSSKNETEAEKAFKEIKAAAEVVVNKLDFNNNNVSVIEQKINQLKQLKNTMSVDENGLSLITYDDIDKEIASLEEQKIKM